MKVEVSKWGNSLALRIPAKIARENGLTEGASAELSVKNGCLIVTPSKKEQRKERLKRMLASLKEVGPDSEVDWGPEVGKEIVEW